MPDEACSSQVEEPAPRTCGDGGQGRRRSELQQDDHVRDEEQRERDGPAV